MKPKANHPAILLRRFAATSFAVAALALLASCGDTADSPESSDSTQSPTPAPEIAAVLMDEAPEGARPVLEVRKDAEPGDEVTVSGKIAGTISPFTDGYATFVFADPTLKTCDLVPDDECPTPWDACCETAENIQKARLVVQVVGEDGRPVAASLEGVAGLSELDELIVTGTVAEGSTAENLIVNADGIHLRKEWVAPDAKE